MTRDIRVRWPEASVRGSAAIGPESGVDRTCRKYCENGAHGEALLGLKTRTLFGDFAVDERGYQIAHKGVTIQWQDGKQVIVWPDHVAIGKARLPAPTWSTR